MKDKDRRLRGLVFNIITAVVVLGVSIFLIWALRPLLLPVILGILLAFLFKPLKTAFKYRWLPNGIRVVLLLAVLTTGLLFAIKFVKDNIPNEKEKLEILVRMKYKFNEKFDRIMNFDPKTGKGNAFYNLVADDINPLRTSFSNYIELSEEQKKAFLNFYLGVEGFVPVPETYYQYFMANNKKLNISAVSKVEGVKSPAGMDRPQAAGTDQSFLKTMVNILSVWFLFPVIFFCFLFDDGAIPHFFIRLVPNRYFELALTVKEEVGEAIGNYLRGISLECALVGITMAAGLFIVGVPMKMALLIGILAGVTTAIPLLGPVVGLSFGLTYAVIAEEIQPILPFISMNDLPLAVLIVISIVLVLDNIVFQPIVLGSAVNLHPLVVILGIMAASMLLGMTGILLAIPAIVVTKTVIHRTYRGLKDYRII